jgi:KDO2-lipid IV(A) lauroyltransferase
MWRLLRPLRRRLAGPAVRALAALLGRAPPRWIGPIGRALGTLAWLLARTERRRAREHVRHALPEAGSPGAITRGAFTHLAVCFVELVVASRSAAGPSVFVAWAPHARDVLDAALAEERGVLFATGHIGNWELMALHLGACGYPVVAVARPLREPGVEAWIHTLRARYGVETLWRSGPAAGMAVHRALRRRRALVGLLVDQDTRVPSVLVPFFGRPAWTPVAPARLALARGIPLVVGWTHRVGPNRHVVHCQRLPAAGDEVAVTAAVSARLEAAIREAPTQWVWMHRRWKRAPLCTRNY